MENKCFKPGRRVPFLPQNLVETISPRPNMFRRPWVVMNIDKFEKNFMDKGLMEN